RGREGQIKACTGRTFADAADPVLRGEDEKIDRSGAGAPADRQGVPLGDGQRPKRDFHTGYRCIERMRSLYFSLTTRRRTLRLGVSSPPSMLKAWEIISYRLTRS